MILSIRNFDAQDARIASLCVLTRPLSDGFRSFEGAVRHALVPRLSGLAALGLVCLMVGATLTNLLVLGASPLLPLGLLALSGLVAWGRRGRTRALLGR